MGSFVNKLRTRLGSEEAGFTLIEVLIVLVVVGILLAIAVPSYLGFKDRAKRGAAEANVRAAVPAVEAYFADHGSYTGMTGASLVAIDSGVKATVASAGASTYCISSTQGTFTYFTYGPSGEITTSACA